MILLAMLGPVLSSLDEVTEADEISSVVESLNSYLQGNSSLAVNGSNFDVIYEAVKSRGYATVYIFRSYVSEIRQIFNYLLAFRLKKQPPVYGWINGLKSLTSIIQQAQFIEQL